MSSSAGQVRWQVPPVINDKDDGQQRKIAPIQYLFVREMLEDDERRSRPARQEDPMSHIRRHMEGIYSELLLYGMGRFLFIIIIIRMCEYVYYYYYYLQTASLTLSQSLMPAIATPHRWCQTPSLPHHRLTLVERSPSNAIAVERHQTLPPPLNTPATAAIERHLHRPPPPPT
jgi:hypothetical protein